MHSIYRMSLILALVGGALSLASLAVFPGLAGILCFYFFGLWALWTVCLIAVPRLTATHLIGLWALVDTGLLVALLAMAASLSASRPHAGPDGADLAIFIAYLPVVFPSVLVVPSSAIPHFTDLFEGTLGHIRADLLGAWIGMSGLAALQSLVLGAIVRGVQAMARRSPSQRI